MIKLKLVNEYLAGPIFCSDSNRMGHIDVDTLPISQELKAGINLWNDEYQATFKSDYPPKSGFSSIKAALRHMAEGERLAQKLQQELENDYIVEYCPQNL